MPKKIDDEIQKFVKEVQKLLGERLKKIILYGSYARGDYDKSSDIDIMILTDLSPEEISKYSLLIWEKCADIEIEEGIVISPLIRNLDNFNAWLNVKPFYMNIANEGVVLSEK